MPDIKSNPEILEFLSNYTDLGYLSIFIFLLIVVFLRVIIQSSSATMALTLIMTVQGWLSFELAAAMVLGENIGTTITANLAAIVANYKAKRAARAHLIFNLLGVLWVLILFYPFAKFVTLLSEYLGAESPYVNAAAVPVAISLFHTTFNITNTFLLVWFVKPISKWVEKMVPETIIKEKEIDEPKFLVPEVLSYPETAVFALMNETNYLFKNAVFQIVAHALSIHRDDIFSKEKIKKIVNKSKVDFKTDIRELYVTKAKTIYGVIINYATKTQSNLSLSLNQNNQISQIKIANRKMVEIIKDVDELSKNVTLYLNSDNEHIQAEYNRLRKKVANVLRLIYLLRTEDNNTAYYQELMGIRQKAKEKIHKSNIRIDTLIRNDLITVNMASSLVNDHDNVNDMVEKLITVSELLYAKKDTLLEGSKS